MEGRNDQRTCRILGPDPRGLRDGDSGNNILKKGLEIIIVDHCDANVGKHNQSLNVAVNRKAKESGSLRLRRLELDLKIFPRGLPIH